MDLFEFTVIRINAELIVFYQQLKSKFSFKPYQRLGKLKMLDDAIKLFYL